MNAENKIEIGSILGGYKIEKVLGRGGMGVVYKGHELSLNRKVAIKVLSQRLCADKEFVERFKREARVIAALNHPHIVSILSYGETDGFYYFAMEYLTGRNLGQILKEKHKLPIEDALSIVSQVAGALSDASAKGVVHRDLKPSNIMVDDMGKVKVTDFGVAHFQDNENQLTSTGLFLGTPEYASPEQATGLELDVRSDIYALGTVLYNMLSGSPPFSGPSPLAVVAKIATEPVPPIRQLCPELPKQVCNLVDKMMAKDVDERFQTPQELMQAVDYCLDNLGSDTPYIKGQTYQKTVTTVIPAQRSKSGLWGGILGVALAVLLVVWLVEGGLLKKQPIVETPESVDVAPIHHDTTAADSVKQAPVNVVSNNLTVAAARPTEKEPIPVNVVQPPVSSGQDNFKSSPVAKIAKKPASRAAVVASITPEASLALPKLPTVMLAVSGDDAFAMQVQAYLEDILRDSGLPVILTVEIPILDREMQFGSTLITWHKIKQWMPPGKAQIVLIGRVRKTGTMELQFYGRTQELITADFTARAVDLDNGNVIGTPSMASAQFTSLNMAKELQDAVTSSTGSMGSAIRQYWKNKIRAAKH